MKLLAFCLISIASNSVLSWENIPKIPANKRAQFYLRHDDGAYKYGYDSGDGLAAKQLSSADNQVEGFYSFPGDDGSLVNVKYTAGVQGFVPEVSGVAQSRVQSKAQSNTWQSQNQQSWQSQKVSAAPEVSLAPPRTFSRAQEDDLSNSDASYQISYNTGEHSRDEKSDASGNVQGKYSYSDEAGDHDLTYIAGPNIGFQVTGGSLSSPNGLAASSRSSHSNLRTPANQRSQQATKSWTSSSNDLASNSWDSQSVQPSTDGAYSFSYNTGDHARTESSDASGNVQGKYSYSDEAGNHDLSYTAGGDAGFVVTGGSLSQPSGLSSGAVSSRTYQNQVSHGSKAATKSWEAPRSQPSTNSWQGSSGVQPSSDGAYSFSYNTGDHARAESSDASGNVQGKYSYSDESGNHDLSYVAGAETGFVVTGGSLSQPNGLPDGAVSSRTYQNQVSHGSKAATKSWESPRSQPSTNSWQGSSGVQPSSDGAYSFSYNTGDHARAESSDASGNVQGKYSYSDESGNHDLSYVAGAETGFVVTGGSLSQPNGLTGSTAGASRSFTNQASRTNFNDQAATKSWESSNVQAAQPSSDGSYSFSYNTGDHSRAESSDKAGNVQGRYSYTDEAGSHDLSYVAGGESGFVVTGGSLSEPNGLAGKSFETKAELRSWSQAPIQVDVRSNARTSSPSWKASSSAGSTHQSSQGSRSQWSSDGSSSRLAQSTGDLSSHPTFTLVAPLASPKSASHANALIQGYLPPQHAQKHGYILDSQN